MMVAQVVCCGAWVSYWHTPSLQTAELDASVDEGGGDLRLRLGKPPAWSVGVPGRHGPSRASGYAKSSFGWAVIRHELKSLGWTNGRNARLEYRWVTRSCTQLIGVMLGSCASGMRRHTLLELSGMGLHEVVYVRRCFAGELAHGVRHAVVTPLPGQLGHG